MGMWDKLRDMVPEIQDEYSSKPVNPLNPSGPSPKLQQVLNAPAPYEFKNMQKYLAPEKTGIIEPGNIDLTNRPRVKNPDGSISTVRSVGVNIGGKEVLLPTVSDDGQNWTVPQAVENYKKTGKHLGVFDSPEASTSYAEKLHQDQAKTLENPENN
jgi:hypothetical protein